MLPVLLVLPDLPAHSVSDTADMLEEPQDNIRRIYDIAAAMAPDYDIDRICKEYQNNIS